MPRDFYDMSLEDAALMFEGWQDREIADSALARRVTMIIADTVNRSMGGKGVMKSAEKIWPLPGDGRSEDAVMKKLDKRLKQQQQRDGKNIR